MKILSVDYGDSRIGLAVCDELEILATPLATVKSESMRKNVDKISRIAIDEGAKLIVVGLPLNMDGSVGERANKSQAFGRVLQKVSGITVEYQDERLTSVEAEDIMETVGVKKRNRKNIVDRIAAQLILESYLGTRKK